MSHRFLGYGRQSIDATDISAVVDVLKSDFLTQGPAVERFEAALAEYVGARHAVCVSSGTAGLHLACLAAGLEPGDTAVVPTMTFVATANAPIYCGARILLTDIDPDTLNIDPGDPIVAGVLKECKAVLPVHFAGLAAEASNLRAAVSDAVIIEDACHALGGRYADGAMVGSGAVGDMTVFSFHPVKAITTGEGGAVTTNDDRLAERLRLLRNHGIERNPAKFLEVDKSDAGPWQYQQQVLGYNFRMTDLQAALGQAQLTRLDSFVARRREIAEFYDQAFTSLANVAVPQSAPDQRARSGLHLYLLRIDFAASGLSRTGLMKALRDVGIGTQVHYIPIHYHPYHRAANGLENPRFPVAEAYYKSALSIPLFPGMTDEDAEYVANQIIRLLG